MMFYIALRPNIDLKKAIKNDNANLDQLLLSVRFYTKQVVWIITILNNHKQSQYDNKLWWWRFLVQLHLLILKIFYI